MNTVNRDLESVLKKVPQYTRLKRHVSTLLSHSTIKKLTNLALVELQRKMRRTKVFGYPYVIIVETGNICNLRCPLCPTGLREKGVDRKFVGFDDFRKIIDRFSSYAYEITLHNWGEPFLNPDILKMIKYCSDKNLGTNLSSNLNKFPFNAEDLITSGLEYLVISLDGATQDVYSKYRVGGDIAAVLNNLRSIIEKKKALKSRTPFIEWQFLVMKHNYHQIEEVKRMADEVGVDLIRFIPVGLPFDAEGKRDLAGKWYPNIHADDGDNYIEERFLQKPINGGCFYLFRSVTVNPVGVIAPCCAVWKTGDNFGNMLDRDFSEIWNNDFYQSARALFSNKGTSLRTCCSRCNLFYKFQ